MQTVELNRGRTEARCLIPFAATAEQVCFPGVEQAARLTRCTDSEQKPAQEIETEWLISSRPADQLDPQQMLQADRRYWGIETPFHFRLDVIAREDDSRVRHRALLAVWQGFRQRFRVWRRTGSPVVEIPHAALNGFCDLLACQKLQKSPLICNSLTIPCLLPLRVCRSLRFAAPLVWTSLHERFTVQSRTLD